MNEWTSLPGDLISGNISEHIVKEFREKYRERQPNQPENIPTWCAFPKDISSERTNESILTHPSFLKFDKLYLYVENTGEVYEATPEQISQYFLGRNPWEEDFDQYIFDSALKWCIAITHKLADGVAVILVGSM